jgi:small multidrug resistance family-3 protein
MKNILFLFLTAFLELLGCYLPFLYFNKEKNILYLIGAAISLIGFAYLLTLQPNIPGKTYIIYGGVYLICSFLWYVFIDQHPISKYDIAGIIFFILGIGILFFQPNK